MKKVLEKIVLKDAVMLSDSDLKGIRGCRGGGIREINKSVILQKVNDYSITRAPICKSKESSRY